jgi:hypothetical protein
MNEHGRTGCAAVKLAIGHEWELASIRISRERRIA